MLEIAGTVAYSGRRVCEFAPVAGSPTPVSSPMSEQLSSYGWFDEMSESLHSTVYATTTSAFATDAACAEEGGGAGKGTGFVANHIQAIGRVNLFTVDGGWNSAMLQGQQGGQSVDGTGGGIAMALHGARDAHGQLCQLIAKDETQSLGFALI